MKPTACPYPFPVMWHRTMAQVMADEARCKQIHDALEMEAGRESVCTAHPGPDQKRPCKEVPG